jgi:hypothetical protein
VRLRLVVNVAPPQCPHTLPSFTFGRFLRHLRACRIDPAFKLAIPRSQSPAWPTKKYFKSGTGSTSDVLASNVVDQVGAYSLATLQNVLAIKAKVAAIQTPNGMILNPTVNAIALNVLELAKPLGPTETTYDLSNPATPGAWPLCTMLSLEIDAISPVTTCATKALMMQFLIWFYTSTTVKTLANSLNIAIVPELFITATGLLDTLQSAISCSGQPLISSATSSGFIQGFSAVQPLLTAYSSFYQQDMTDYVYSFATASETLATQRVVAGEIDLALVNTKQLAADDVALMTYQNEGIFLPAFYTGVAITFTLPSVIVANYSKWNALTDTRGGLPNLLPMALDMETVAGIFAGQITSWTDPAILATSPQVGDWFNAHPQVSTAFKPIVCCSNILDAQAAGTLLLQALNQTKVAKNPASSKFFTLPVSWSEQQKVSTAFTLLDIEARMTAKMTAAQTAGSSTISYRLITTSATDPVSEFRIIQTVAGQAQPESVPAQPSAFKSCITDAWKNQQLTSPSWNPSPITGCYPLAAPLSFGVGMAFEGDHCNRGNRSLNYFNWINTNPALSTAAINAGVFRVSDIPEIQLAIETQLNMATCDGETLLITLPKVWTVNAAITGFGIAVMSILLAVFVASAIVLAVYRQRTVLRSSSVPFLGLILLGLSMLAMSIGAWSSTTVSNSNCGAFMWLASLGFSLVFVPFFAKTYRIYLIFSRQKLQVVKLSNKRLGALVGAFFIAELIVMIAWSQVSPLQPVTYFRNISGSIHQATHCSVDSAGMTFVVIEAVYKGLLLVVGSLLAFRTRKVSSNFNESSSIAMSIYSCLFSSLIIGALIYFVSAFEDTLVLLMLFLIFWLATVTWALVFGAKFYALFSQSEADAAQASKIESLQTEKSQGGFSFVSVAAMPMPIIKSYIQALEGHLSKAKKQLTLMLGTTGDGIGVGAGAKGPATGQAARRGLTINTPIGGNTSAGKYVQNLPGEANCSPQNSSGGIDDASSPMLPGPNGQNAGDEVDVLAMQSTQHGLHLRHHSLLEDAMNPASPSGTGTVAFHRTGTVSSTFQAPLASGWTNSTALPSPTSASMSSAATPVTPAKITVTTSKMSNEKLILDRDASSPDPKLKERRPILIGQQSVEGGEAGSPASSAPASASSSVVGWPSSASSSSFNTPPMESSQKISPSGPVSTAHKPSSRAMGAAPQASLSLATSVPKIPEETSSASGTPTPTIRPIAGKASPEPTTPS